MYVYKERCEERSSNSTSGYINVAESNIPQVIIFNVGRKAVAILSDAISGTLGDPVSKWWTNTEFFLEWFSQLAKSFPAVQLLILLVNFHVSHETPDLLNIATENNLHLGSYPSHSSHLLQKVCGGV